MHNKPRRKEVNDLKGQLFAYSAVTSVQVQSSRPEWALLEILDQPLESLMACLWLPGNFSSSFCTPDVDPKKNHAGKWMILFRNDECSLRLPCHYLARISRPNRLAQSPWWWAQCLLACWEDSKHNMTSGLKESAQWLPWYRKQKEQMAPFYTEQRGPCTTQKSLFWLEKTHFDWSWHQCGCVYDQI